MGALGLGTTGPETGNRCRGHGRVCGRHPGLASGSLSREASGVPEKRRDEGWGEAETSLRDPSHPFPTTVKGFWVGLPLQASESPDTLLISFIILTFTILVRFSNSSRKSEV